MSKKIEPTIAVTIMSPESVVWKGDALSLSSTNSEGNFDIIPDHARFMTLVEDVPIIVREIGGEDTSFKFDNAVLFFQDNSAKIYVHKAS